MNEISSHIAEHRVLIDNVFIDVTLFEGIEEFYVSPINVVDKCFSSETLEESEEAQSQPVDVEEYCEELLSDDIVYDPEPTEEIKEDSITTEVTEVACPEENPFELKSFEITEEPKSETAEPNSVTTTTETKKKVTFKCNKCKKQYVTISSLDMHRWKCHKIPLPSPFKRRQKLDIGSEKDIYFGLDLTKTCEFCFKECLNYDELKSHLESSHNELPRKYTCKVCLREFKTRETVRTHYLSIHTDQRREFKCQHCDKTFFHKRSLQNHEEITHLGIFQHFICDICGQKSSSRGDLNRHKLRHDKIKKHACHYQDCGKR